MTNLTPEQLDQQCKVHIHKWLDMDSEDYKLRDDNIAFSKKCLRIGFEDGFLFVDKLGRVWGIGNDGFYPFHFEYGNKLYGYRIAKKAAN